MEKKYVKKRKVNDRMKTLNDFYNIFCNRNPFLEIRMLKTDKGTISGYYEQEHYADIEKHIRSYDGKFNIFFTLNQVDKNVTARSSNHLIKWAKYTTKDSEIIRRKWILIDLDPVRPAGVSSTDKELGYAEDLMKEIEAFLCDNCFTSMVKAMSGNGYHILLPIDEPNEPKITELIKTFLASLDAMFSNKNVKVDVTTYNAARITKLYGTMACKGDSTEERPHRRSYIVSAPDKVEPASMELLKSIIDLCDQKKEMRQKSVKKQKTDKENAKTKKVGVRQQFQKLNVKEFCKTHGIKISCEKPLDNGICYVLSRCPWNEEHSVDKGAYIVQLTNNKIVAGCHHDSCRDENWSTLLRKYKVKQYQVESFQESATKDTEGMSAADILMEDISQSGQTFFHDKQENAYVSLQLVNGHKAYMTLEDSRYKKSLIKMYYDNHHKTIRRDALQQVFDTLAAKALFDGEEIIPSIRCKYLDGTIYYYLSDNEQTVISIDEDGVHLLEESPVPFIRKNNMTEQIVPFIFESDKERNVESFCELTAKHWRFATQKDDILHNIVLLTRFISDIPAPILYYQGDRGSAKTTCMRMDKMLVDPSESDIKMLPKKINDVVAALSEQYMVCFDNVGTITKEISDLFCICSTSGKYSKRKLFTDNEQVNIDLTARISMTGITTITDRSDFLDRCINLSCRRVCETERKTAEEVLTAFRSDLPYILYQAMRVLSEAVRIYYEIEISRLPRMADFARWGYAIAEVLGYGGETFLEIYKQNQEELLEVMVEEDILLTIVISFINEKRYFKNKMEVLLTGLTEYAQSKNIDFRFIGIKTNKLSEKLFQSVSVLRQFNIYLKRGKSNGNRYVEIWKEGQSETDAEGGQSE